MAAAYSPNHLSGAIYAILREPGVDFDSISAKRVRARLASDKPSIQDEVKECKKEIDELEKVKAEHQASLPQPKQSPTISPSKRKRDSPAPPTASSSSIPSPDSTQADLSPEKSKTKSKATVKAELLTDEELARQLSRQINGARPARATTRNSRASTSKSKAKSKSGTARPSAKVKSEKYVVDSDDPDGAQQNSDSSLSDGDNSGDDKPRRKSAKRNDDDSPKKKPGGAFNKEWLLSDQLAAVTGETELSRPQVVKHIWAYIKENQLQDPRDGRKIICDEKLQELFGCKRVSGFTMNKYIGKHLYPLD